MLVFLFGKEMPVQAILLILLQKRGGLCALQRLHHAGALSRALADHAAKLHKVGLGGVGIHATVPCGKARPAIDDLHNAAVVFLKFFKGAQQFVCVLRLGEGKHLLLLHGTLTPFLDPLCGFIV